MKKSLVFALLTLLPALLLCGKDDGGDPYAVNMPAFKSDTSIVRAILDANGITGPGYSALRFIKQDGIESSVDSRVVELRLPGSALGDKRISTLPASIGSLTELVFLDLQGNDLTTLPAEIGQLKKVTQINAAQNKIVQLPSEIGTMDSLKILGLSRNMIAELPATIGSLANLAILKLDTNSLTSLPSSIGSLSKLEVLRVGSNQLTTLPAEIVNLSKVSFLNLDNNRLCTLDPAVEAWVSVRGAGYKASQQGCQ